MIKSIVSKAFKMKRYEIKRRIYNIEKIKIKDNIFIEEDIPSKSTNAIAVDAGYNYEITRYGIFYILVAILLSEKEKRLNIIDNFADINIINYIKVKDAREILDIYRKIIETRLILKNNIKFKNSIILYDGSLYMDILNFISNYKNIKFNIIPRVPLDTLDYDVDLNRMLSEYYALIKLILTVKNIVCIPKTFTKNIYFDKEIPEICVCSKHIDEGYTKPKYKFLNLNDKGYTFSHFYLKFKDSKRVLLIEVPDYIDEKQAREIASKLKSICIGGYPYILRKAHYYSRVKKCELKFYMKRLNLKSLREELHK